MRFSDQVEMEDPYACAICWHRLSEPVVLNCGHTFHLKCAESLTVCPLCREKILARSTNWQLLSIIERKNRESASSRDSSSDEGELKDSYIPIRNWQKLSRGTLIQYTLNAREPTTHYGWFINFDLEKQLVQIQLSRGKAVRLPLEYIKNASYHPDLVKETVEYDAVCCNLL
jgi:hypothetical protein